MLFTSYGFIAFVAVLTLLYYLGPANFQWILLLVGSYIFYLIAGPEYIPYLLAVTLIVYFAARIIDRKLSDQDAYLKEHKKELTKEAKKEYKAAQKKKRMVFQIIAVVLCVAILALVKYANFFLANINAVLSASGQAKQLSFLTIAMPLGISFYTLQALSYLFDVSRGTIKAEKNVFKFALFVSFFPQLVQGPISRFKDLSKTLYEPHPFNRQAVAFGLQRILWGFFKKLVIADRIAPAVQTIFADVSTYSGGYAFFGMLFYTIQLYADFTGGIDITIGIAQMLGIEVAENFNLPYFSTSLKEYWRRWHITMCSWFRDYIFYPLSSSKGMQKFSKFTRNHLGQKVGRRLPVNISSFVVWFVTGMWHGASWNFIVWGLANFVILMVSEEFEPLYEKFHNRFGFAGKLPYRIFQILRTFVLICALNMFDVCKTIGETVKAFLSIFTSANWGEIGKGGLLGLGIGVSDYIVLIIGILIVFAVSLYKNKNGDIREGITGLAKPGKYAIWIVLIIVVIIFGTYGIGYDSSQFIYNQF
ncbi:MAG: MBOAT family protein [Parasporobacterium sp.]|nr:MBOAT family protein [Parasporobacterium sp.]